MTSFIKPDDIWVLWTIIIGLAALSIYLEQKTKIGAKITGPIIGLGLAMIASNVGIIPMESSVYDGINTYLVPVAVVLLLFKSDIKKIFTQTKKTFLTFHLAALGTFLGTIVGVLLIRAVMPEIIKIAPSMVATYIGGSVNFIAMSNVFQPSGDIMSAALVADNLVMAIFILILLSIPGRKIFRKHYPHPYEDLVESKSGDSKESQSAQYWKPKEISLINIAMEIAIAFLIATASVKIAEVIGATTSGPINAFFGNQFVILTTITLIFASVFPNFFSKLNGADEIGTFIIYIFFVTVGIPASIREILTKAPLLLVFASIICLFNVVFGLVLGKLFKCNIEEIVMGCNATLSGPAGAAALAIAKGWNALVVPGILMGLWGYIVGNYCGIFIGNIFGL